MAIQKKTEGRDLEEYLQEVWDSLEPAWDKSKFDMKQGYDSEYECDCITITSKDNEGVLAKIYVNDYEGRHPVGFDVVYRYPGDKGVGVMGSYEFHSTDMDGLGEEVFDYFDEIKKKAAGASFESDLQAYADAVKADKYDKQSVIDDGWEFDNSVEYDEDIVRDDFKQKYDGKTYLLHITFNPSTKDVSDVKWDISAIESKQTEADSTNAIEKFAKEHGAEYEDEKTLAPLFKEAVQSVIGEKGTVGSAWTYTGSNNYGYVDWEASITGVDGMLPEDEIVIVLSTSLDDGVQWLNGRYMDENDTIAEAEHPAGDGQFDPLPIVDRLLAEVKKDRSTSESKKSEADATFKVGDFVNYDAESDGDKLSTGWAFAEVVAVNDDGTLKLQPYNLEDYDEVDGVNPQFCEKMEHFAGMTDANTYYMDGKYNVYTGYYEIYVTTKELGKPYGFAGTLDSLDDVEQLMDYYDETMVYDQDIQDEVMSAVYGLTHYDEEDLNGINFADLSDKTESKKSEGLPPKKLGDRKYRSRADLINKMKQVGATEITTRAQYDELHSKQWLHKGGYAMDINGNLVGQTYFGDKDGKWYYATTKTFQGDYLPECKESKKSEKATVICSICGNPTDDPIWGEGNRAFCKDCYGDGDDFKHGKTKFVVGMMISLDGVKQYIRELKPRTFVGQSVDTGKEFSLPISSLNRASILYDPRNESKKSESLTLKQKELKDMARFGQAEDITTISDEEAKALRKKGIETIGISRGTYGMNGALLRDNEGKKYVITARSSNLFYFV